MTPEILLQSAGPILDILARHQIRLTSKGDRLIVRGRLTQEIKEQIRACKPTLLQFVKRTGNPTVMWQFSLLRIPNQNNPQWSDLWVTARCEDKPDSVTFWFWKTDEQT